MRKTAKFVTFGNGGDTVYYSATCRCSGYGSPENPHAAKEDSATEIPDGTPALDKRPALATDSGAMWAVVGPMVNVDLAPGGIGKCPDLSDPRVADIVNSFSEGNVLLGIAMGIQNCKQGDAGPLDEVDIETYVEGWVSRGARLGHYQKGEIVWES